MSETPPVHLYEKLLGETARVTWLELERLFAAGCVIRVGPELDLIEVGRVFAEDDSHQLRQWMQAEQAGYLDDQTAARWACDEQAKLWAVVVRPWVLVQERIAD